MHLGTRGISEINDILPPLDLTQAEVATLADELMDDHAAFAERYSRQEQAQGGYKYVQELMRPIERKSMEPMALDGGNVQAMPQLVGQGQWADEPWLHQH
jgi:hypothetical protein